jgi:hypothetical protein
MIAEQAGKCSWQWFFLFWLLWLSAGLLAFPHALISSPIQVANCSHVENGGQSDVATGGLL